MAIWAFRSEKMVIRGQIVSRSKTPKPLKAAGVTLLGDGKQVSVRLGGETLVLRDARLITRPSGQKRHLSRYLVGISALTGWVVEIFLEVVSGGRNAFFKLKSALQGAALKFFSRGLNLRQRAVLLGVQ
jgi:hypothetical protein